MPTKLTHEIITAAILGFEEQKRHIDTKIAELRAVLSGGRSETASSLEAPKRKRRKMSAAARARIAEAQQKMGRVQEDVSTLNSGSGSQAQTKAFSGRQKGDHRRHEETLGVKKGGS